MVWPYVVLTNSLNVTATLVAVAQLDEVAEVLALVLVAVIVVLQPVPVTVLVVVPPPVIGVWPVGQEPVEAGE